MGTIREGDLARHFVRGARKLRNVDFGRASTGPGDRQFDKRYWKVKGIWKTGSTAEVLTLKDPTRPALAVVKIFERPGRWQFDCSEFAQVISYYAWLKLVGAREFNKRVRESAMQTLEIRPFQGSPFTLRDHYFWRDTRKDWMKLLPNGRGPAVDLRLTVREIVDAAPIGSRVLFRSDKGSGAFRNENTIKVRQNRFAAHGYEGTRIVYREDEVIKKLYEIAVRRIEGVGRSVSLEEARRHVWIKEVAYFRGEVPQ